MRPETSLLRLCAAVSISADRRGRIQSLIQGPMDWELFMRLALQHRVFSLAFKALSPHAAESVPPAEWDRLRTHYFANLTKNLAARKELVQVIDALRRYAVTAVPYKGPVLAEKTYGDIGLRHFNDLDVLVREEDLEQTVSVLQRLGYESELPRRPSVINRYRRFLRDYAFRRPDSPCPLEIQWRLVQKYHPVFRDREAVWNRLRDAVLEEVTVRTLSPEDALLVLCLHGLYHSWEHLQMVSDVAESVTAGPLLDWPGLVDSARRQGGLRILLLGLLLARDLLETALPPIVLEAAAADRFPAELAARISASFFNGSAYLLQARSFFFLEARMIAGLGNRVRYFGGRIFTPNEEDMGALTLPAGLFLLHPVWRAARLLKKYFFTSHQ